VVLVTGEMKKKFAIKHILKNLQHIYGGKDLRKRCVLSLE